MLRPCFGACWGQWQWVGVQGGSSCDEHGCCWVAGGGADEDVDDDEGDVDNDEGDVDDDEEEEADDEGGEGGGAEGEG
jgi:hypothetical protein